MTDIEQHDSVQVFVGVDVGKGTHHAIGRESVSWIARCLMTRPS
jgi:hypothetical protein